MVTYQSCMQEGIRPIVVIGASAGGVQALSELVRQVDNELPAAYFAVLHLGAANVNSNLPQVISRSSNLPVRFAQDKEPIQPRTICLAPPDRHLIIQEQYSRLMYGPRENWSRPAIDPLFRSAAVSYRSCVVGVVLTGMLDDGSTGISAVKRCGGLAVVQDPTDAQYPDMPESALIHVKADYCVPLSEIGAALRAAVHTPPDGSVEVPEDLQLETRLWQKHLQEEAVSEEDVVEVPTPGKPISIGCPSCGGPMWEISGNGPLRYHCEIGHRYTAKYLLETMDENAEESLWVALRLFQDRARMHRRFAHKERDAGRPKSAQVSEERAKEAATHAEHIMGLLKGIIKSGDLQQKSYGVDDPEARL